MIVEQDLCVSCDLPCIGRDCSLKNVLVNLCDECQDNEAQYRIDGECLCEECAYQLVNEQWDACDLYDKCRMLDMNLTYIGG